MDNKYYTSYRRFTYDFSYEDQEKYGELEQELNLIESKEVVSEEEYETEIGRFETNGDIVGLEQYRNRYITEVDYYFARERIQNDMKLIETMYRVTAEQLAVDKEMRAKYAKDRLKLIKRAYESRGSNNIMRDVNVDLLTDDEAIEMYRNIDVGLTDEMRQYLENSAVRDRVSHYRGVITGGKGNKQKIEDDIEKFNKHAEKMKKHLQEIKATLVLNDIYEIDVTDELKNINTELKELDAEADGLIAEIDEFKALTGSAGFSMSVKEIKKVVEDIKVKVRDLKRKQVELYNVRVDSVNERISELKSMSIETPEVVALIEQLNYVSRCDDKISSWQSSNYLSKINYNDIVKAEKIINEIIAKGKINVTENDSLESYMSYIEESIINMDALVNDGISKEEFNGLKQGLIMISDDVNEFRILLENNKDKIGEKYQVYLDRLNDVEASLANLNYRLNGLKIGKGTDGLVENNDYQELMGKLNSLELDVNNYVDIIESLFGKVVESALSLYKDKLDVYQFNLNLIKDEIEVRKNDGKLDDNQYNNLMKKVDEIQLVIERGREKIKDPKIIVDADIFAYLNKKIDGVEKALDTLEAEVEALGKPIKDRNIRKHLDFQKLKI